MSGRQLPIIIALGTTQTLAWASSYYLPAILADPIARDLGVSSNWIFGAFSGALVISAMLGPRVGRQIDLVGGRSVLSISNFLLAAGLVLLGCTYSIPVLAIAWLLLGIGMGLGLYDAAFAALGRIYGDAARGSITGITLIAGFASTVGWPLSAWGLDTIGWRETCFAWAAAHILIGLPINFFILPAVEGTKAKRLLEGPSSRTSRSTAPWRCWHSCSPRHGRSPAPWARTCRAFSRRWARPACRRSPQARCWDRRRYWPASLRQVSSAAITRCCRRGLPA